MSSRSKTSLPPETAAESRNEQRLLATVLFLMTEYIESRRPMLAALVAGELLALERQNSLDPDLAGIAARLRHRWWRMAQNGVDA